jgi:hypothetical protein
MHGIRIKNDILLFNGTVKTHADRAARGDMQQTGICFEALGLKSVSVTESSILKRIAVVLLTITEDNPIK